MKTKARPAARKMTMAKPARVPVRPGSETKRPKGKTGRAATEPQIESLLERVSDGFVAFDAQLNYTYVNARGGELLGRKPAELIGKNYWTEYPEAKGTPFANAYLRGLETQEPLVLEDYYAPFDRWFENRVYPSKDGLSIFFTDITERKRAEEMLRESEEKYRALNSAAKRREEERILFDRIGKVIANELDL